MADGEHDVRTGRARGEAEKVERSEAEIARELQMEQKGEWIPPSAPLSEGYWQALLRDGEVGQAAPTVSAAEPWQEQAPESEKTADQATESIETEAQWEKARESMARGEILELPVVGCNRGGLLVGWNGLRGFVPASHLMDLGSSSDREDRQEELRRLVGTRVPLKIIELDAEDDRFVLSERAAQAGDAESEDIFQELKPGDICQGRVTNLCSFGAFVDLGGFEGLVHISELSWGRVGHPSDVLELGEDVEVYVLNVEPERERVGLSIKRLQPNPWQSVEERYRVGQTVEGTVTHVVDFGAFVQVEKGLEGLIHVSEMASGKPCDPFDVVQTGDSVSAEVLSIDGSRRRMGLRLQQIGSASETPSADLASREGAGPDGIDRT